MKINDWEGRSSAFLSNVFDEDSNDIIEYLLDIKPKKVAEIGFGNNRLLIQILNKVDNITYYGFDKTKTFVDRAKKEFNLPNVEFEELNIEDIDKLSTTIRTISPDVLILRYIIEHIPSWKNVLEYINKLNIPSLLISIFTPLQYKKSWTLSKVDEKNDRAYTVNFISTTDLSGLLNLYVLTSLKDYKDVDHTFMIYKRLK